MKVTRLMWAKATKILFVRLTNEFVSSSRQKQLFIGAAQQCYDERTKDRRFLFFLSGGEETGGKTFPLGEKASNDGGSVSKREVEIS